MSWLMLAAAPHAAEPTRNVAMVMRYTVRRPKRSLSLPRSGVASVEVRM